MPKTNFNKVLTLWTCQTYMENMSTALKPDEISFGVLLFRQKLRQFRTFLKLLPSRLCSTRTQILFKSETAQLAISKYFCLKYLDSKKMEAVMVM